MIETIAEESLFEDYVRSCLSKSMDVVSVWYLYDFLKKQINDFEIEYETGIKIIVGVLEI